MEGRREGKEETMGDRVWEGWQVKEEGIERKER